jgi:hypothetical protein
MAIVPAAGRIYCADTDLDSGGTISFAKLNGNGGARTPCWAPAGGRLFSPVSPGERSPRVVH